jgi:ferritin
MAKGNGLIPDKIVKLLNYRINQEEKSTRLYLAMSEWLENAGFLGAAKLWRQYSSEENVHANWAYSHLKSHDYLPDVGSIGEVKKSYESLVEIVYDSYKHEIEISKQCNELARQCIELGDYYTLNLALKYTKEQTEELDKLNRWVSRLVAMGNNPKELRLLDDEMMRISNGEVPLDSEY